MSTPTYVQLVLAPRSDLFWCISHQHEIHRNLPWPYRDLSFDLPRQVCLACVLIQTASVLNQTQGDYQAREISQNWVIKLGTPLFGRRCRSVNAENRRIGRENQISRLSGSEMLECWHPRR